MNRLQVLEHINAIINRLLAEKGERGSRITAGTVLLGGVAGVDSLDLALLVRELEDVVGRDPFHEGFVEFRTAEDLAKLYAEP
jgi:acyl carrier protein